MNRYQKNKEKIKILINFLAQMDEIASPWREIQEDQVRDLVKETKARLWEIENDSKLN